MSIKFALDDTFHRDVRARVDRYFRMTHQSPRDSPRMYIKTAAIFLWLALTYVLLLFFAEAWWQVIPLAISLALAVAAVGFNVQHDGGHRAFSRHRWVNRWAARSLDLLGGSSFIWDHKHNTLHHTYANIAGHDDDIDVGSLARLSPEQPRLGFHRFQHLYMWMLYSLLPVKWHLLDDFRDVAMGRIGDHRFGRPRGADLAVFIGGKVVFFSIAFVIPLLLHPWWAVLGVYLIVALIFGLILSVVFQLAHVVEEAEFPTPDETSGRMPYHWAVHQVETTVDFAQGNRPLTWFVGGLNYQIEHHLFPRICHIHYPRISRIVARCCRRHGIEYNVHRTVHEGIASHFHWLRRMGRPQPA
jgi:linoleoyl-CoA desaturase